MTAREALLGPSYRRHVRLIERSRTWTPPEIEDYQQARLQKLIRRYGDKITHKEDYRVDLDRFARWNVPLLMQTIHTAGSSGEPLRFRMDTVARQQKELAYMFNIWSTIGYSPFDVRVVYRGDVDGRLCRFEHLQNRWGYPRWRHRSPWKIGSIYVNGAKAAAVLSSCIPKFSIYAYRPSWRKPVSQLADQGDSGWYP